MKGFSFFLFLHGKYVVWLILTLLGLLTICVDQGISNAFATNPQGSHCWITSIILECNCNLLDSHCASVQCSMLPLCSEVTFFSIRVNVLSGFTLFSLTQVLKLYSRVLCYLSICSAVQLICLRLYYTRINHLVKVFPFLCKNLKYWW